MEVGMGATMTNMEDSDDGGDLWRDNDIFGYKDLILLHSLIPIYCYFFIWLFKLHV